MRPCALRPVPRRNPLVSFLSGSRAVSSPRRETTDIPRLPGLVGLCFLIVMLLHKLYRVSLLEVDVRLLAPALNATPAAPTADRLRRDGNDADLDWRNPVELPHAASDRNLVRIRPHLKNVRVAVRGGVGPLLGHVRPHDNPRGRAEPLARERCRDVTFGRCYRCTLRRDGRCFLLPPEERESEHLLSASECTL